MPKGISFVDNDSTLVFGECPIQASDAKLTLMLGEIYETARADARNKQWHDWYGVVWSASFSIFLTLVPTLVTSNILESACWLVVFLGVTCLVLFVLGVVMILFGRDKCTGDEITAKGVAIKDCISRHVTTMQP